MIDPVWEHSESPFHAGELEIQARLGVREKADKQARRMVRDYLSKQHRQFFATLPYLIAGTVDSTGAPWASILVGSPGFLTSPDKHTLIANDLFLQKSPLLHTFSTGADIGLLGIDLQTRRRNRLNGTLTAVSANSFAVSVSQSFGNCPQYIQTRTDRAIDPQLVANKATLSIHELSTEAKNLIEKADTFFIATAYQSKTAGAASGIDVSHRGGNPGFIKIENNRLTIPDFAGNNHFNTIGNLLLNPRAGLLFIDFENGNLLQITGSVKVSLDSTDAETYPQAQRFLYFEMSRGYWIKHGLSIRWGAPEFSPYLSKPGSQI